MAAYPSTLVLVPSSPPPDLIARVQHAASLLNAGRFADARVVLESAVQSVPNHPDLQRLLAAARRGAGDLVGAEAGLRAALNIAPDHQDAAVDLALLLSTQARYDELLATTTQAAAVAKPRALLLGERARALKALGRLDEALKASSHAARLYPDNPAVLHNLAAIALDAGRAETSVSAAREALKLAPHANISWLVLARALQALNQLDEAEAAYRRVGVSDPARVDAAAELAQLIWMRDGNADAALAALADLLPNPQDTEVRTILRVRLLAAAGDPGGAADEAEQASNTAPGSAPLAIAASQALMEPRPERALVLAQRALQAMPDDAHALRQWTEALIGTGDGEQALPLIRTLRRDHPLDQGLIAAELTALRLAGQPQPPALSDLDAVVGVSTIDTPPGWPSLDAFLADLTQRLERLHADRRAHPIGQSLRQGTQTGPDLATLDDPVIAAFRDAIRGSIDRHIAGLGRGNDELRRRITEGWRFQGMWSARLQAGGGRHTNHVHPDGWLSSACYIALPTDVAAGIGSDLMSRSDGPGRLQLGQPGGPAGRLIEPERFVQPQPGRLVLFPSYLWHGTSPFQGPGTRLSIAFDIVPA